MKGGVKLFGVRNMMDNLESLGGNVRRSSRTAILKAGAHLEGKLKRKLSEPGTGREYRTGKKGSRYRFHRASAPGQPPAIDTGRSRGSITHNITGSPGQTLPDPGGSKTKVRGYVGTNVDSLYHLERGAMIHPFGNLNILVPLLPRPWMYPTLEEEAVQVAKIVRDTLQEAINEARMK